jgi:hypothetical protein
MRALLHETVRAWLVGLPRVKSREAQMAVVVLYLWKRAEKIMLNDWHEGLARCEGAGNLHRRLLLIDPHWEFVIKTMQAGWYIRRAALKTVRKRYEVNRKEGRK